MRLRHSPAAAPKLLAVSAVPPTGCRCPRPAAPFFCPPLSPFLLAYLLPPLPEGRAPLPEVEAPSWLLAARLAWRMNLRGKKKRCARNVPRLHILLGLLRGE